MSVERFSSWILTLWIWDARYVLESTSLLLPISSFRFSQEVKVLKNVGKALVDHVLKVTIMALNVAAYRFGSLWS